MELSGLHLLLTYQCNLECKHCFVWGSPRQSGTMNFADIQYILRGARETGSIQSVAFEGGEPFLYYALLLAGVREAASMGFKVGVVSNAYWANSLEDSLATLRPFAGLIKSLTISSDLFHWNKVYSEQAKNACTAAEILGMEHGIIAIAGPGAMVATSSSGEIPEGVSKVMFRGRAAVSLATHAGGKPWEQFTTCPFEDLRAPGRAHLDPFGNLHLCQGISLGNIFSQSLDQICKNYDVETHPIAGLLVKGGSAELVRAYDLPHEEMYADACHLCYSARKALRTRFPDILTPDQMYGVFDG